MLAYGLCSCADEKPRVTVYGSAQYKRTKPLAETDKGSAEIKRTSSEH